VPLAAIAAAEGTPLYVYSAAVFRERYQAIDGAFNGYPHALHYALKANPRWPSPAQAARPGSSVDANSVWEIEVARRAGFELLADCLHRRRQDPRRAGVGGGAGGEGDQRRIGR
jgi:diaminopimelate decarboxylase